MNERAKQFKPVIYIVAAVFAITLAVLVGERLSDEAMAALAGAVCGVGAAIPTSLLILAVARTRRHGVTPQPSPPVQMTSPQMMMIPPMMVPQQQSLPPATWETAPPIARRFTVVGGEAE